jgi:uncharacterized protein YjgD (DUF1641 family)
MPSRIIKQVRDDKDEDNRESLKNREKIINNAMNSTSWEIKLGKLDRIRAEQTDYVYVFLFQLLIKTKTK